MFNKKRTVLLVGFLIAAVFCIPFYSESLFCGLDLTFHLSRFDGMLSAMRDLQFPIAIYPDKNFGFGYASPLFYCDLFIFPAALLYAMNIPLIIVYKIYVFLIAWLGASAALYAMNYFTKRSWLAVAGAILFMFTSYHINDYFIRAALGEMLAFSILPLFPVVAERFFVEKKNNTIELALFFSALALSHLITFALCAAVFAVLMIVYLPSLFRKGHLFSFLKAVLIGLSLCAFFLFPLLQQMRSQTFLFAQNRQLWGEEIMRTYSNTLLSAVSDFILLPRYELEDHHYFVGLVVLISPFLFLLADKKDRRFPFFAVLTVISLILFIATTDLIPLWKIPALQSIQFTYRFNILIATFLPFAMILGLDHCSDKAVYVITAVLLGYTAANTNAIFRQLAFQEPQLNNTETAEVLFNREFYENYNNYYNVSELSSGEYLPATHQMNYKELAHSVNIYDTTSPSVSYTRNGTKSVLKADCSSDGYAALPLTWYLGYAAELTDSETPEALPITKEEYTGRIVLPLQAGDHTYRIYYKGTTIQKASLLYSFISLLVLAGYLMAKNIRSQ